MGTKGTAKFYRIPEGKGPYSVGCTDLMTDDTVQSQASFLRLYYPSQNTPNSEETQWIPRKEYYCGLSEFLNMYRVVGERLLQYYFGSVICPAKWNTTFKPGEKYPLIIFSHGLGAFRTLYSAICTEMASQGFIVASVEHRDKSASATYYLKEKSCWEAQEEATSDIEEEWIYYQRLKAGEEELPLRHKQVFVVGFSPYLLWDWLRLASMQGQRSHFPSWNSSGLPSSATPAMAIRSISCNL